MQNASNSTKFSRDAVKHHFTSEKRIKEKELRKRILKKNFKKRKQKLTMHVFTLACPSSQKVRRNCRNKNKNKIKVQNTASKRSRAVRPQFHHYKPKKNRCRKVMSSKFLMVSSGVRSSTTLIVEKYRVCEKCVSQRMERQSDSIERDDVDDRAHED